MWRQGESLLLADHFTYGRQEPQIRWGRVRQSDRDLYRWKSRLQTGRVTEWAPAEDFTHRPVNVGIVFLKPGVAQNQRCLRYGKDEKLNVLTVVS